MVWMFFFMMYASGLPVSPITTWVRVPQQDSAIIQSERLGGNFAYSTIEGHAYAALNPLIENVHTPIAVNYDTYPLIAPYPISAPILHI